MADQRIEKLADVLVNYSTAVQPGDRVFVHGNVVTEPLIREVYAKILQAGGHPFIIPQLAGTNDLLYRYASDKQLAYVPEPLKMVLETYDVVITIMGSENTKALTNVDPEKILLHNQSQTELSKTLMQRMSDGSLRWVGTEFPTNAGAQDAEMSLREFEDLVYGACLPDLDNPIGYWQRFSAQQTKIVDWFKGKEEVRVVGPETDLRLSVVGRTFMSADGRQNMPDGE
ncbi:MAG: aminopeptidase, partial [Chloroflexota bacterium]